MHKQLVCGVGTNDAEHPVVIHEYLETPSGRKRKIAWKCPYYTKWHNMLFRCYDNRYHQSYTECTVCEEWLTFSNFKSWMEKQDWKGKHLDKDLLSCGPKIYSDQTCVFIEDRLNYFLVSKSNKSYPLFTGIYLDKRSGLFTAECQDPFGIRGKYVGRFETPEEAHLAWKIRKHEYACQLADLQKDERVAKALRTRYL